MLPKTKLQLDYEKACARGDIKTVEKFINGDTAINDSIGLLYAYKSGHEDIVKLILSNNCVDISYIFSDLCNDNRIDLIQDINKWEDYSSNLLELAYLSENPVLFRKFCYDKYDNIENILRKNMKFPSNIVNSAIALEIFLEKCAKDSYDSEEIPLLLADSAIAVDRIDLFIIVFKKYGLRYNKNFVQTVVKKRLEIFKFIINNMALETVDLNTLFITIFHYKRIDFMELIVNKINMRKIYKIMMDNISNHYFDSILFLLKRGFVPKFNIRQIKLLLSWGANVELFRGYTEYNEAFELVSRHKKETSIVITKYISNDVLGNINAYQTI
jgi:hypothetical protein